MPGPTWVDRFLSSNAARLDPRRAHEILREFRGEPLQNAGGIELNDGGSPAGTPHPPSETADNPLVVSEWWLGILDLTPADPPA